MFDVGTSGSEETELGRTGEMVLVWLEVCVVILLSVREDGEDGEDGEDDVRGDFLSSVELETVR